MTNESDESSRVIDLQKVLLDTKSSLKESRESLAIIQFWTSDIVQSTICELNAAEFPLFFFSTPPEGMASYTYGDTINFKGTRLERSWQIVWTPQFGYPSASTQETFFALLQMAREQGFPRYIDFGSVYELKKRMGKKNLNSHYKQTLRDLHCLLGMRVITINSCWDRDGCQYHPTLNFGLFNTLGTETLLKYDELSQYRHAKRKGKLPSVIEMSDIFHASLKSGNTLLLSFDSDFFYSLSPIEQRLTIILTKYRRFYKNKEYSRNLMKLAEQIPLFAKKQKHLKSQLKRSLKSLQSKGLSFLKDFSFDTDGNKEEKVVFTFTEDKEKAVTEFIEKSLPLPTKTQPEPTLNFPIKPVPKEEPSPDLETLHPSLRDLLLKHWTPPQEE